MPKQKEQGGDTSIPDADAEIAPRALRCKIIGIGGAGVTTLGTIKAANVRRVELIAADTDSKSLVSAVRAKQIRLGETRTRGLSAGGDAVVGRQAAEENSDKLYEAILGADLILLLVGLGGGTGSGAAPVVAQLAQQTGALTLAIGFQPFEFESAARRATAQEAGDALRAVCDATLFLAQNALLQSGGESDAAFRRTKSLAAQAASSLVAILTENGVGEISLDDLRKAWGSQQGEWAFGFGENDVAAMALKQALASPTCAAEIFSVAGQIFAQVRGGDLRLSETVAVVKQLREKFPKARVSLSTSLDARLDEARQVTLFAARPCEMFLPQLESDLQRAISPRLARTPPPRQQTLNLETYSRGRFEKSEETIYEGEDLDIPTFVRRGVKLV